MAEAHVPYISPLDSPKELTARVVIVGIVIGLVMTAANAYLGLYAGMTVSASIPAAVMSMIILRLLFDDVSILENNSVQTMASAGESLAAGVIFTIPALLVAGLWIEIEWVPTLIISLLGGLLGTMFTIALRRLFIVEEALPYPEGVACKEVLVAGETGGDGLIAILYALGIGALYGLIVKGTKAVHHSVEGTVNFLGTKFYGGIDLSIALFSVGYIVGIRIASFIFFGGIIGFGILVPLYGFVNGWPATETGVEGFSYLWKTQIRYAGVGAMVVGGIYTLWSMRKTIITGLSKSFKQSFSSNDDSLRTEKDLPLTNVIFICGLIVICTFIFYWTSTNSFLLALAGALFLALVAFFFAAVAGYIAGVVGSSNSPVSGMTIATLLFTVLLVWVIGDLILDLSTQELMLATLLIASVVATSAAIAGDVMQDLKTGHMLGATPWKQQIAEVIGVVTGAIIIGPTLTLLHDAYRITVTACEMDPIVVTNGVADCSSALLAPQAELIGAITQGAFTGDINFQMVLLGALIAAVLIWRKMPVMSVAIGIYLPLGLSVPIMLGGVISAIAMQSAIIRIDGNLNSEPSKAAKEAMSKVEARGVLIGAGFIAGESLLGVVIAAMEVLDIKLYEILGINTLGNFLSLVFFAWFVGVFMVFVWNQLPSSGNILKDVKIIIMNAVKRLSAIFYPIIRFIL